MNPANAIAANARAIREGKGLTLEAAAQLTGVSRSMLAQVERGEVNPTISLLWKISNGYRVSFTSLLESPGEPVTVLACGQGQPLEEDQGRFVNYPVFAFDEKKLFETYRIIIQPGGELTAQPHLKGAEEYITVFRGRVEIRVEEDTHLLETGDSIRFLGDLPHGYRNPGREEAHLSMIIYYNR